MHGVGAVLRAVRGATTVAENSSEAILQGAREMVLALQEANDLSADRIVAAFFTTTPDLTAAFPAQGAREAGWGGVPLLCASEIPVPGAPDRCIRVMVLAYFPADGEVRHVYLRGARALRPDLA
ncbi:MAG: chorismate mutase [Clostridia bacterium]|nr:chorismate mutase [Clostridia bacterium]